MSTTALLFAHGAGAGSDHPWMRGWAERLAMFGSVHPFDYPYMQAGRRLPDRLPALVRAHAAALDALRSHHDGPIVLVGKSMGSRVGCHLALTTPVDAIVCLGYPLVGGGKRRPVRDAVLKALTTPVLFVQGTRDRMAPLDVLAAVRAEMQTHSALHVVEGGDHGLEVGKRALARAGEGPGDVHARILAAIHTFLDDLEARG